MKRISIVLGLIGLLAFAAPVAAKPKTLHYEGETAGGQEMEFNLTGKRLSAIDGLISTTCVPTHGPPLTFSAEFIPPGSFALGKTRKASRTEYMSYKGDVTKNYSVAIKRAPGKNRWIAKIHLNFSYEEVVPVGSGELEQRFYICQGDDSFTFAIGG